MKSSIEKLVKEYGLCIWCIGRQLTDDPSKFHEVGEEVYRKLRLKPKKSCELCNGFFEDDELLGMLWKELSEYEFDKLDFSVVVDPKKIEFEDELRSRYKIIGGLVLKKAALAYLRRHFSSLYKLIIEKRKPDLRVYIYLREKNREFRISSRPLLFELRFLKHLRESRIRASPCRNCGGVGCKECRGTGKANDLSFEAYLLFEFPKLVGGDVKIRWSVRDFENSIINGLGRPIYLMLKNSKRLKSIPFLIPYKPLSGFQISLLRKIEKEEVEDTFAQSTLVTIITSRKLHDMEIKNAESIFRNKTVLITDRNGKTREKHIQSIKIGEIGDKIYRIFIKHETGLNLEKFLSGKGTGSDINFKFVDAFEDIDIVIKKIDVLNVEEKGN